MRVDVYDRFDAFVGTIPPDQLVGFKHVDELNGEDSVSITTTYQLREGYRLVWSDNYGVCHEHVCQDPQGTHDSSGMVYTDTALNSICETFGDYIEDAVIGAASFARAMDAALSPTRWTLGTCDVDGQLPEETEFLHTSAREAIQTILESGGELETVIVAGGNGVTSRTVNLLAHRGSTGGHRRFAYGKDTTSVSKTEHYGAITACYGYGKTTDSGSGTSDDSLTFGSINGGLNYVEDEEAKQAYGRPDGHGGYANYFDVYENGNCEDAQQLLDETRAYLDEHKVPGVTYEADVLDLVQFGRQWEGVGVGDDVQIVDHEFSPELRCEGRVTKLETDMLSGSQTVTLGNVTDALADIFQQQQQQLSSLTQHASSWDLAAGTSPGFLQQLVDALNERFNVSGMSYCHTSFERGTIWSSVPLDESGNPTEPGGMAIQICSEGFRIASKTNADGSYDWSTFGTGEGFVADHIVAGTLVADLIRAGVLTDSKGNNYWDLDTGEFRLSSTTTVGDQTVQEIAEEAVDGQTQDDIFNKLTNNGQSQGVYLQDGNLYVNGSYIKSGSIDADLITTGSLNASLITSGSINADLITTGHFDADLITTGRIESKDGSTYIDIDTGAVEIAGYPSDADVDDAAKTATNYLRFDSSGLCVGNMTGSLGYNTLIRSDGFQVRNGSTVLSSFSASSVSLGQNSTSSTIDLCGGLGTISYGGSQLTFSSSRAMVFGRSANVFVSSSTTHLGSSSSGSDTQIYGSTIRIGSGSSTVQAYYSGYHSLVPVYRLSSPSDDSDHVYTTSTNERNTLLSQGWGNDGTAFYAFAP